MPIKIKPDNVTVDRTTGKRTVKRFPMQSASLTEIVEMYSRNGTTPKAKQKLRNELVRRKAEIPA
jgi:hypothetical protein|tara:strand:- start:101 stop:295 length:195 start_codon:yes stop_codon:yes gene_type:complete